ncbi:hypothetical protein OGV71_12005 [Citrobacter sp. Cf088]|uniref:hypothetical protein n=1 Tax=Citrobacter sp. Cf088 TaxID=2985055 RepID=UPI002578AC92|nr:hypothetical protein [Citrobacter sp. Cf088]MDM3222447.1 hypothetical protein [Citrobacter sp. Cf088]
MIGYAIGSFFGMLCISTVYGVIYKVSTAALSEKINQAWKHRPARFIILVISAIQLIIGLGLNLTSYYMLYLGATFVPYEGAYGVLYTGDDKIVMAWIFFGVAMGISFIADILKVIFVLTFAD